MKLSFVIPWYGTETTGGLETDGRETVEALRHIGGLDVEVLTTCVRSFDGDRNPGRQAAASYWVNNIPVRAFPVQSREIPKSHAAMRRTRGHEPASTRRDAACGERVTCSPALDEFIRLHGKDRMFVFVGNLRGATYEGFLIHPERSVIVPFLQDDSYTFSPHYLDQLQRVRGLAFRTKAEFKRAQQLCQIRPDAAAVVGRGIDTDFDFNAERFVAKYGLKTFILYVRGRQDQEHVALLIDYFTRYKRHWRGDLKLVLLGKGSLEVSVSCREDVIDLGFLPEQDRRDACAAALALYQPATMASFPLSMTEAWVSGTPALVPADAGAAGELCLEANGGLLFATASEFGAAVRWLQESPSQRRVLGRQGRTHVLRHFAWDAVVDKYCEALCRWGFPLSHKALPPPRSYLLGRGIEAHQLLAGFRAGDAISQMAMTIRAMLRSWGFASEIFAEHIHQDSADDAWPIEQFRTSETSKPVLIYNYSIDSSASEVFLRHPGTKVLLYHNITPPHFFAGYSDVHVSLARSGRERLRELIEVTDLCMGVSRYNCLELEEYGARDWRVLPVLPDLDHLGGVKPDSQVLERFGEEHPIIIFVGRLSPNKRQDDLIRAFAQYRKTFNSRARLILVGGYGPGRYEAELRSVARDMDIGRAVTFAGYVNEEQLAAYYRVADALVSMSEHEGFGVPLIEAMYFDIPVIAYAAAGVPYTLGDAGVLVHEKDFAAIAEVLHRILADREFRNEVLVRQRRRLEDFSPQKVAGMLKLYLEELLEE